MKKTKIIYNIAYYALVPAVWYGITCLYSLATAGMRGTDDLGTAATVVFGYAFVLTPAYTAAAMRFSLLRAYIDPFAAAEIPLAIFLVTVAKQFGRSGELSSAFLIVGGKLSDDYGIRYLFFAGLFIWGLAWSFSKKRLRGESVAYRLLSRLSRR